MISENNKYFTGILVKSVLKQILTIFYYIDRYLSWVLIVIGVLPSGIKCSCLWFGNRVSAGSGLYFVVYFFYKLIITIVLGVQNSSNIINYHCPRQIFFHFH